MITAVAIKAEDRLFIRTKMLLTGAPESENWTFAIKQSTWLVVWTRVYVQDKTILNQEKQEAMDFAPLPTQGIHLRSVQCHQFSNVFGVEFKEFNFMVQIIYLPNFQKSINKSTFAGTI